MVKVDSLPKKTEDWDLAARSLVGAHGELVVGIEKKNWKPLAVLWPS